MAGYCRACRSPLRALNTSTDNHGFCATCGRNVVAVRPSSVTGEWFFVAESLAELTDGQRVVAGQCEVCALGEFTLRRTRRWWDAVCEGQEWDGEFLRGCGTVHPVRLQPAHRILGPGE